MEKALSDGTFSSKTKGFAKMQFDKIEQIIPYLTFHLSFNQNESHFSTLKQMQKDNGPDTKLTFALLGVRGDYYANLKEDKTLQQFQYLNKDWSVAHPISDFNWQISSETKTIQGYLCRKATSNFQPILSRKKITVWFTTDIPFQFGPLNYTGLPGLILQAEQGFYIFYATDINLSKKKTKIKQPLNEQKEMTLSEFRNKRKTMENRMKRHHSGQ